MFDLLYVMVAEWEAQDAQRRTRKPVEGVTIIVPNVIDRALARLQTALRATAAKFGARAQPRNANPAQPHVVAGR